MVASTHKLLTTLSIAILAFSTSISSIQSDAGAVSLSQLKISDSPVRLHQLGQCPASPKPVCSDINCQGPDYINPMQYQCIATTAFQLNSRAVTLTNCRCCPLPIFVWCPNHDCRAPTGTRQCASTELEGCACETDEDRRERFHRELALEGPRIVPEGEDQDEDDWIDYNDDGILDNSGTQTQSVTAGFTGSPRLLESIHEHERHRTGAMTLPTLAFDQPRFEVTRDVQANLLHSCS